MQGYAEPYTFNVHGSGVLFNVHNANIFFVLGFPSHSPVFHSFNSMFNSILIV